MINFSLHLGQGSSVGSSGCLIFDLERGGLISGLTWLTTRYCYNVFSVLECKTSTKYSNIVSVHEFYFTFDNYDLSG